MPVSYSAFALFVACSSSFVFGQDGTNETRTVVSYSLDDMQVWERTADGKACLAPALLFSYLKSEIGSELWRQGSCVALDSGMVVMHSQRGHLAIRKALAKIRAFGPTHSASEAFEERLEKAKAISQHVIVFVSECESDATKRFFDLRYDDGHNDLQKALRNFQIHCVGSRSVQHLEALQNAVFHKDGSIFVLDQNGNLLASANIPDLSESDQLDEKRLTDFLNSNLPVLPVARQAYETALENAKTNQSKVLLVQGGPDCLPCIQLLKYLESKSDILKADFIVLKIDSRMTGSKEILDQLRGTSPQVIPWMCILSEAGEILATSDSKEGNIGFPRSNKAKEHFANMLRLARKRISEAEIKSLIDGLPNAN